MSDKPSTQRSNSPLRIESPAAGGARWRQVCNPLVLGLLGLALAVTLWGYGSRFLNFTGSGGAACRLSVARIWIEHRDGFTGLPANTISPKLNPRAYADSGAPALLTAASPRALGRQVSITRPVAGRPRSIPFFHTAIPLRSPPHTLSL